MLGHFLFSMYGTYKNALLHFVITYSIHVHYTTPNIHSNLLTYLLTKWSIVLLKKLTGSQLVEDIPRILWNPKVHYRINKFPPHVLILSQINQLHTSDPTYLLSLFHCFGHNKLSIQVRGTYVCFVIRPVYTMRSC